MAGIIDIRYDISRHIWTAKPRFASPDWGWADNAPSANGSTPYLAICELSSLLPIDMGRRLLANSPRRIYRSPEYEYMDDKCIDADGHLPNREEWARRRREYLFDKKFK